MSARVELVKLENHNHHDYLQNDLGDLVLADSYGLISSWANLAFTVLEDGSFVLTHQFLNKLLADSYKAGMKHQKTQTQKLLKEIIGL